MIYGAAVPALTYTYTGLVNGDTGAPLTGGLATTATSSSPVGTYPISLGTLTATGNYTIGTFNDGALTIAPAPLTITANDATKVYGSVLPALSPSYVGFVNGDTASSLTTPPALTTTATSSSHVQAGGYPIIAAGTSDPNYTISYASGTLTVTPAPLIITAGNATKVYGAALPSLTASYHGLTNGDLPASLTVLPVLTTTASASSPVRSGGYTIVAARASDPNYTISYQPGSLLITPAPLTIAALDASMVQGAAIPQLAVKYTGFVNGDSPARLSTPPTLSTTATSASSPGIYPILVKNAASPNYTINYVNGTLVVIPAPVSLESVSIQSVRVGKSKKTTPVVVMQFSGALDATAAENISSYTLTTVPVGKTQKSQTVHLSEALYNAATDVVTLITEKPLVLDSLLKLTCNTSRLLDSYGRPLSGDSVAMLRKK